MMKQYSKSILEKEIKNILWCKGKFFDPTYSEHRLMTDLGVSRAELRGALAECFQSSFAKLCNKYRVMKAKQLLTLKKCDSLTMEDIALMSGFNNRQTFAAVFRKEEGITPRQYKCGKCNVQINGKETHE